MVKIFGHKYLDQPQILLTNFRVNSASTLTDLAQTSPVLLTSLVPWSFSDRQPEYYYSKAQPWTRTKADLFGCICIHHKQGRPQRFQNLCTHTVRLASCLNQALASEDAAKCTVNI